MSAPAPHLPHPAWADLSTRAELSAARRRVLEIVERSKDPMTAAQVAKELGLHHNTVREHLEALTDSGLISVSTTPTGRRGRPALRYASTAPDPAHVVASCLSLLDAFAETLGSGPEAHEAANRIGHSWARHSGLDQFLPVSGPRSENRAEQVVPVLSTMGFSPTVNAEGVILRSCPLVSRSRGPHPLVCRMHEGFLNEVVSRQEDVLGVGDSDRTHLTITPLQPGGCQVRCQRL